MTYEIEIDFSRDSLFDELGKIRLKDSYMKEGETSPQERFAYVSSAFASNQEHAQRLYEYSSKHWLSYSTPILAFGRNKRGLPISCYLNHLSDTSEGLVNNLSETNWLSMLGGGVGVHFQIRGADDKSVGVMPHLKTYDASSLAYKQGNTRRGSYAAYLDISHPDIIQFLEMRKSTGDQNMKALNLNHGVNVPDSFMQIIERCMVDPTADDSWELIQPNSGKVVETVSAKYLWMKLLELRMHTGEPYIWFIDRANEGLPDYQKKAGLKNYGSNLCLSGDTMITVFDTRLNRMHRVRLDIFINSMYNESYWKVWSFNLETGTAEWKDISAAAMTNPSAELYEIEDEESGKIIRCTADHKIYTKNRGYVMAKDLLPEDELIIG